MDDYVISASGVRAWKKPEAHPLLRHTDTTHPSLLDKLTETYPRGRVSGLPRILSENSDYRAHARRSRRNPSTLTTN